MKKRPAVTDKKVVNRMLSTGSTDVEATWLQLKDESGPNWEVFTGAGRLVNKLSASRIGRIQSKHEQAKRRARWRREDAT